MHPTRASAIAVGVNRGQMRSVNVIRVRYLGLGGRPRVPADEVATPAIASSAKYEVTYYSLYIFDLDGTLFRGDEALPGAVETVATLRAAGCSIRYLTNNSTRRREQYVEKLLRLGFDAKSTEIYTSALGLAESVRGTVERAYVIGEEGLVCALDEVGICIDDTRPELVAVGLSRQFDYRAMASAMKHLRNSDVRFLATNRDATFPLEGGLLVPGAGAIVSSLVACAGREPEVIGKPNPYLIEWILRDTRIDRRDALVVGDRYETDIVAGRRADCAVHLVLTGVTSSPPADVEWSRDVTGVLSRDRDR
jgi:4-nitrophenyl phosphatase